MIYQLFDTSEAHDQCAWKKPGIRPLGIGAAVDFCQAHECLHAARGQDHIHGLYGLLNDWTAIYWLWKNLKSLGDPHDWIGLSDIRRPCPSFMVEDTKSVESLLEYYDILAWNPSVCSLEKEDKEQHPGLTHTILACISACYGQSMCDQGAVLASNLFIHPFSNCFVMKKDRFAQYAEWSWGILQLLVAVAEQKREDVVPYQLQEDRNLAVLAERLLPFHAFLTRAKVGYFIDGQYHQVPSVA